MERILEYFIDFRVFVGAVIGFGIAIPVVLNNPGWFSSRIAAVQKAGQDAIDKAQKSSEYAAIVDELKKRGIIKE